MLQPFPSKMYAETILNRPAHRRLAVHVAAGRDVLWNARYVFWLHFVGEVILRTGQKLTQIVSTEVPDFGTISSISTLLPKSFGCLRLSAISTIPGN
jgi:hypothetical protein